MGILIGMRKAFFIDRDGVVNVEVDYLHRPEDVILIDGLGEALGSIHRAGYLAVVVSNQSGVARGMYTMQDVKAVEDRICELLRQSGSDVPDAFYYCPHHKKGIVPELAVDCDCRKPKPGMFLQAARDWEIDPAQSYMIGDRMSDLHGGMAAGCANAVLVLTGYGENDAETARSEGFPVKPSVLEAVEFLLGK